MFELAKTRPIAGVTLTGPMGQDEELMVPKSTCDDQANSSMWKGVAIGAGSLLGLSLLYNAIMVWSYKR
jgi:hypothetical protein